MQIVCRYDLSSPAWPALSLTITYNSKLIMFEELIAVYIPVAARSKA